MPSERIARSVQEHSSLLETFTLQAEEVAGFAGRVVDVFNRGGKLLAVGAGPMGAVAGVLATHFLHRLSLERPPLPVFALTHDALLPAALEVDGQARQLFARQVQVLAAPDDIVLALFGVGREESVLEALALARHAACFTAAFLPGKNDLSGEAPNYLFRLETDSPPRAIEGALFFGNLLCDLVEAELFGI